MVAVNPKLMTAYDIAVRPSMNKFPSEHTDLEICSVTCPHPAFLNRQIIVLLEGLGVPESVRHNSHSSCSYRYCCRCRS